MAEKKTGRRHHTASYFYVSSSVTPPKLSQLIHKYDNGKNHGQPHILRVSPLSAIFQVNCECVADAKSIS